MLPALENQPDLPEHLGFAWRAFWHLHTDRPAGMGSPMPIAFSAIDRYARRYAIDDVDEFDRITGLIQQMDAVYLDWANHKLKQRQSRK